MLTTLEIVFSTIKNSTITVEIFLKRALSLPNNSDIN